MTLPSIALHLHHNASLATYYDGDVTCVIEVERMIGLKNASFEFFEPVHCREFILERAYDYLKEKFGYEKYQKMIVGYGFDAVPQKYMDAIPAEEYIVDQTHHGSHAAGSFYQSPHEKALIVSFDGGANDGWFNVFLGNKGEELSVIHRVSLDLGSHYHVFGALCEEIKNYHVLSAAGKVLGLQSYGNVISEWKKPIREFFRHVPYFDRLDERISTMSNAIGIPFSKTQKLSGELSYDLTRTMQEVFEDLFFENIDRVVERHPDLPIILTGGCAMNITLNSSVGERYGREVFIAPNSSDCGIAVGLLCRYFKPTKVIDVTYKGIEPLDKHCLLGYVNERRGKRADLKEMVLDLASNKIIGVVQGRSEHGPRALGNRSIICSPISAGMKDMLNAKVKHREWYRPFAPIVRLEDVSEYFEWEGESRWMNFCVGVKPAYAERLLAVTHVDNTARIQTVTKDQNPLMYDLLSLFKEKTGVGVLVNTSFNVDRKPILSSYKEAFKVLDETELDRLYLDGFYFN